MTDLNPKHMGTADPTNSSVAASHEMQTLNLAFLGSLLPGIIHNWATPLSGVIGATQLLEKRVTVIEDLLKDFDRLSEAELDELKKQMERNRTNVDILSRNAQHLADLLQILVYRITRGSGVARDIYPLNELLQNELRFLDANLKFKHKVRKNLSLEPVATAAPFAYGYVAAAIDEFVTLAVSRHDFRSSMLDMEFASRNTGADAEIYIAARLVPGNGTEGNPDSLESHFAQLREDGWTVRFKWSPDNLQLTLARPPQQTSP